MTSRSDATTDWPCNCIYHNDPYKAPELHARTCPVWKLAGLDDDWWFDGDYSECYYAWGHVDKDAFGDWVTAQEKENGNNTLVRNEDVEHLWALELDEERFTFVAADSKGAKPITRYRP